VFTVRLFVVLGMLLVPLSAAAQEPGSDDPLLPALVEEALRRNPDVTAAQQALVAGQARPAQARSLSNPMLGLSYTNEGRAPSLGATPDTVLAIMGSQDLPYPGKRRLRGELAGLEAGQLAQQLERVRLSVAAEVRRAYYGLVLARALQGLIREQEQIWIEIEGVARARYTVGQGVQQDVLRIQVERTRIGERLTEQAVQIEIRQAELNRLLARPAGTPLESSSHLDVHPVDGGLDATLQRLSGTSPELRTAALAVERAGKSRELAGKEYRPDFSVQAAYMNRGGLPGMWLAGIGISVPAYRERLAAGVAEAEARRNSAQQALESVRLQLRFRAQERLAQLRATEHNASLYEKGVIPQGRMSVDAALASYQSGKVPFLTVLEAITTLYNDRATLLGFFATHAALRASLEEASLEQAGGMPSPTFNAGSASGSSPSGSGMGNQ
jgi:outer membrane protein TolC